MDAHNVTAWRIQSRNVTISLRHGPVMGARRQTLAQKQRMATSQGGTDKYAFRAPNEGHFVDNEQSHCRPVVRSSSQSKN